MRLPAIDNETAKRYREAEQLAIKHLNDLTGNHYQRIEQFSIEHLLNAIIAYQVIITELKTELRKLNWDPIKK